LKQGDEPIKTCSTNKQKGSLASRIVYKFQKIISVPVLVHGINGHEIGDTEKEDGSMKGDRLVALAGFGDGHLSLGRLRNFYFNHV
jgi:hypothetical protein